MSMKVLVNLDLHGNQIENVVLHNLAAAPATPKEGMIYYNTTDHYVGIYENGAWVRHYTTAEVDALLTAYADKEVTFTNKTMDADSNTFSNFAVANFKEDAIALTISEAGVAVDTKFATEKAVRDALDAVAAGIKVDGKTIQRNASGELETIRATAADILAGTDEDKAVTAKAALEAMNSKLVGSLTYRGAWEIAEGTTDYSGLEKYLPIKQGDLFAVTGVGATIGDVEYLPGDHIIFNAPVSEAAGIVASVIDKIDNTESSDIVRLAAAQTLTNKTIDAASNTISNLKKANVSADAIAETVAAAETASADKFTTEKAVRDALDTIVAGSVHKVTFESPELTPAEGVATWSITHNLGADAEVQVREAASGELVLVGIKGTATGCDVTINADVAVTAGTYKAVVMG